MIIKQFVYFAALAEARHFGRAAEACHVSQPTLSSAIRQLEDELGVMLVERGHRFTGLTPEGEVVLDHARRIVAETETLKQAIADMKGGVGGRLRLGAIPTALPMITRITAPFSARFPAARLTVMSMTSDEIMHAIRAFEIDVGVTYLDNEPLDGVVSRPIYREAYVLLTGADTDIAARDSLPWAEAAQLRLCLLTADMQNRRIVDGIFRSVGVQPTPAMETNSIFNLCTHAGVQGLSSIVPRQLLDYFGMPPGIRAVPLVDPDARRTIGLVAADREPIAPMARHLLAMTPPIADAADREPGRGAEA